MASSQTTVQFTTCPLCEANCGLRIETDEARERVLSVQPDPDDPLSRGHMCVKAKALPELHEDPDRLRSPVRRSASGEWEEIGWDEALDEAARKLDRVRARYGKDAVALYVGNPSVYNHEALLGLAPLLAALRTKNRYSATSTDQLPQMLAAMEMFGHQLMMPVPDIDRTDFMVIIGANPMASNGSIMTAPGVGRRLKAIQKRGGRVVVIDPRRTETAAVADEHHFIRPGTDALLLSSILHVLFDEERVSLGRISGLASGLSRLRDLTREFSPERVAPAVGIHADAITRLARALADAPSAAVYGRVGVCTQRFGSLAAWLTWVVSACTGNLDRRGGMMFARPAVDGVALAATLRQTGGFDRWRSRVRDLPEFNGEFPVATLADEIETPGEGQVRALVTVAGNPVSSAPNGAKLDAAMEDLEAMVAVDIYVNETTRHADLILPPVSQLQRPYFHLALSMYSVRNTAKARPPVLRRGPDERDDGEILLGLARRLMKRKGGLSRLGGIALGAGERLGFDRLLDSLLRLGPHDLTLNKLQEEPHGVDLGPLEPALPDRLYTDDERVHLAPTIFVEHVERLRAAFEDGELDGGTLRLIGRRNLRSNNSWMHNVEPVSGAADCTLMMHPSDATDRDLEDGARVTLRSRAGHVDAELEVTEAVMPGVVSLPHGHGHDREGVEQEKAREHGGISANDVTDETFLDELTGTAAFNGVPVVVESTNDETGS